MNLKQTALATLALILALGLASCEGDDPAPRRGKTTAVFNPDKEYGTVTDIDGNEYRTIAIGTQTWMAENLRVTHYRNGDPIPNEKDARAWDKLTAGAYCSYGNTTDVDSIATFGYLYNWYTCVDERGLCPDGWHVPSDAEWTALVTYLDNGDNGFDPNGNGTNGIVGGRMKEIGSTHWLIRNQGDNSSGFTALPGGYRTSYDGCYNGYYDFAFFWSSTKYSDNVSYFRSISSPFTSIIRLAFPKEEGMSVRCIKN